MDEKPTVRSCQDLLSSLAVLWVFLSALSVVLTITNILLFWSLILSQG